MIPGYREFEFDLPQALLGRLIQILDDVKPAQLDEDTLAKLPEEQGVYQLFLDRGAAPELMYIGKTDNDAGLRVRLSRHFEKIQQRIGLDPSKVFFRAVRIFVFTAVDLEAQLIEHYGGTANVPWNGSGFGSNDPGRERDTTNYKAEHFDAQFPIDIARPIDFDLPPQQTASFYLKELKKRLPYLIRFEVVKKGSRTAHEDLEKTHVSIDASAAHSPESLIRQVVDQLPDGWHATQLPSHVIIYKNDNRKFPSGKLITRSGSKDD